MNLFEVPLHTFKIPFKEIIPYIQDIQSKDKGLQRSNLGGWHSENFTGIPSWLNEVFTTIHKEVHFFGSSICNYTYNSYTLGHYWFNCNPPLASNKRHFHSDSTISGVVYFKVPKNSGNLIFHNPYDRDISYTVSQYIQSYTPVNSSVWSVEPKEFTGHLFNSYVDHSVGINNSTEDRISMSFNYNGNLTNYT